MAEFTPASLAQPRGQRYRKEYVYLRDTYNFSSWSVSSWPPNPRVHIPATGPNSAGAVPPASAPSVKEILLVPVGCAPKPYGVNGGRNCGHSRS